MTTEKNRKTVRSRPENGKLGRNTELIAERNTSIVYRYYYYCQRKRMLYNEAIAQLCREYYLTEYTIRGVIEDGVDMVRDIRKQQDVWRYCKEQWKHMVWE